MAFTEYTYKFLHRPIIIRVKTPLDTRLLDYIATYIERYKREVSLSNSISSAVRFNEAPVQFPFAVDTLFLDYLYELYKTFEILNLLEQAFSHKSSSRYEDIVLYDLYDELVVKKEPLTLKKEMLYTSILLDFIHDILAKYSQSFSLSSGKYFIGKNAFELEAEDHMHNASCITHEYTFTETKGFTVKQAEPIIREFMIVGNDLQLVEAFSFISFTNEFELEKEAKKHGIVIQGKGKGKGKEQK